MHNLVSCIDNKPIKKVNVPWIIFLTSFDLFDFFINSQVFVRLKYSV